MGHLVIKTGSGNITYGGNIYTGWAGGTKKLHIKTASNGTLHYPLTTHKSASEYCKLKILYNNSTCYLARSTEIAGTISTWKIWNSRESEYDIPVEFTSSLPFVGSVKLGTISADITNEVDFNANDVPLLGEYYRGAFTVPIYAPTHGWRYQDTLVEHNVPNDKPLAYSIFRYTHQSTVQRSAEILGRTEIITNTRSGTRSIYPFYYHPVFPSDEEVEKFHQAESDPVDKTYFTKWLGTNTTKGTLSRKSTYPSNGFLKTLLSNFVKIRGTNYSNAKSYKGNPIYSVESTLQPFIKQMKGIWSEYPDPQQWVDSDGNHFIDLRYNIADIYISTGDLYATSSRALTSYKYSLKTYQKSTRASNYFWTDTTKKNGTRYELIATQTVVKKTTHNANI